MAIDVESFKGEVPRIARRLLGNEMAQVANNPRLLSGNLETWKGFDEATTQNVNTNPLSIYFLDDQLWLTWNDVGVVSNTATVTATTLPSSQQWSGCAYNGEVWVTMARNAAIAATSPDGINWTQQTLPIAESWNTVAWNGSIFLAMGEYNSQCVTSPDGVTWTAHSSPAYYITGMANVGTLFCAVGSSPGNSATTVDGTSFIESTTNPGIVAVAANETTFVGVGGTNNAATSLDGINWTARSIPSSGGWSGIAYGNGLFLAVASNGTLGATSPDGVTWTAITLPAGSAWGSVCFDGAYFVLVSNSGTSGAFSTNGLSWTNFVLPSSGNWQSVASGGLAVVAIRSDSANTAAALITFSYSQLPITAPAIEADVAKMAIGGDTSCRTIFCGTDVPRFTDLGLASGLVDGSGHPVTGSSAVATNPGPYPIYSRKLGVPNPTVPITDPKPVPAGPGANAVTITETFDAAVQWNLVGGAPGFGIADIPLTGGDPGACLNTRSIGANLAYGWKTFGIDNTQPSVVTVDFAYQRNANDYEQQTTLTFFCCLDASVSGTLLNVQVGPSGINWNTQAINSGAYGSVIQSGSIASGSIPTWSADPYGDANWLGPWRNNHWYTATLTVTPSGNPNVCQITLVIKDGATTVLTITSAADCPNAGPGFGFGGTVPAGFSIPYWIEVNFDNLTIAGTGPVTSTASSAATTYLYTLVNDLGEESGPCPAMVTVDGTGTITRTIGQGVTVNLPASLAATGVDTTYFESGTAYIPTTQIAPNTGIPSPSMNLYRAVTGSTGTAFLLVAANIPFAGGSGTSYTDSIPDSSLSEVIQSTNWYPPPTDMLGILALPNEIYAGFTKNQLCLSEQGIPHAWPIIYRLTFDFDMVGIGNIDNTVVACTKKFPWLCSGNTPDAYSQTQASYPYACASKRSIQFLENVGVVFATFEGLVAISGPGSEMVLTRDLFTKKEWLALNPSLMIGVVNDDRYFCFFDATGIGGVKGGFYLDLHRQSPYPGIPSVVSGKISLDFHATCRYNDPLSDILYLVIDAQPTPLGITDQTIVSFDTEPTTPLPYLWHSKQFYVPYPATFQMARITADSYANTILNLFADGVQYASIPITSQEEFTLPLQQCLKYFEFELVGTDTITRAQFVEDAEEFT